MDITNIGSKRKMFISFKKNFSNFEYIKRKETNINQWNQLQIWIQYKTKIRYI